MASETINLSSHNLDGAWGNETHGRVLINSNLIIASGSRVVLRLSSLGQPLKASDVFIGIAASGANFDGNQKRVTFGGSNSFLLAAGQSLESDRIEVTLAASQPVLISFSWDLPWQYVPLAYNTCSGVTTYYGNSGNAGDTIFSPADSIASTSAIATSFDIITAVPLEQVASIRIASVAEASAIVQVDPAAPREAWKGIQVRKATPAEKAYEIYVDAAARLEKAAQLSVIATMGFEAFAPLLVKGSLAAFEQFATLSVEARERMVFETYRRLAVLGEVDSSMFEQSVGLIIDNSVVEFMSFQEQIGLYYRQFEMQVNVHPDTFPPRNVQLIRSLPLYASASLVLQSTLLLPSGPITQVDRIITLMYDGLQEEARTVDQQTGAESVTATLRLVSPTAGLGYLKGDSGSRRFSKSWPSGTMASEIMDELFAGSGLSYDLRIDDFPIGQQLTVENKFPFEIWPLLFIKERIRTGDDGDTLIIAPVLPCLPAALPAHPLDHDLDPGQYMVQSTIADDGAQIRYNMIRVANYQDADAGAAELLAEKGEVNSSGYREIFGWPMPWRKVWLRGCHLPHDGYELRAEGVAEEIELEETISFDGGTGRTQRPIYALLTVDWSGNASLGAVTPGEDGTLTAATAGKSVAVVRYKTRRYKFLYRDEGQHETDVWLTDEED